MDAPLETLSQLTGALLVFLDEIAAEFATLHNEAGDSISFVPICLAGFLDGLGFLKAISIGGEEYASALSMRQ